MLRGEAATHEDDCNMTLAGLHVLDADKLDLARLLVPCGMHERSISECIERGGGRGSERSRTHTRANR